MGASLELRIDAQGVVRIRVRDDEWRCEVMAKTLPSLVRVFRILGFVDVMIEIVEAEEW